MSLIGKMRNMKARMDKEREIRSRRDELCMKATINQLFICNVAWEEGIKIEEYITNPIDYDADQLKEIYLGIKHNVNIEEYARITLSSSQMREIREGLEEGIKASLYAKEDLEPYLMRLAKNALIAKDRELFSKFYIDGKIDEMLLSKLYINRMQQVEI